MSFTSEARVRELMATQHSKPWSGRCGVSPLSRSGFFNRPIWVVWVARGRDEERFYGYFEQQEQAERALRSAIRHKFDALRWLE